MAYCIRLDLGNNLSTWNTRMQCHHFCFVEFHDPTTSIQCSNAVPKLLITMLYTFTKHLYYILARIGDGNIIRMEVCSNVGQFLSFSNLEGHTTRCHVELCSVRLTRIFFLFVLSFSFL